MCSSDLNRHVVGSTRLLCGGDVAHGDFLFSVSLRLRVGKTTVLRDHVFRATHVCDAFASGLDLLQLGGVLGVVGAGGVLFGFGMFGNQ